MIKIAPRPGLAEIGHYMVGISKLPGFDKVAKLSSNESPVGMSPHAREAARRALADAHLYPEVDTEILRDAVAARFGLNPECICFGPGSDELLLRLVSTFSGPGDEVVFSQHAYMQFPIYAKCAGATPVAAPDTNFRHSVDKLLSRVTDRTRIVIVANPDNPSGTHMSGSEIRRLRRELPDHVLLIIDGAYEEYAEANDYETGTALVEEQSNVVVTRTFSKLFGMAGLRLGWCYAPPDVVDLLERIGPSFPVNTVANAAALAALQDTAHLDRVLDHTRKWRDWFSTRAERLGLVAYPSQTNFVLVRFPEAVGRTPAEADARLQVNGIIARRFACEGFEDKLRFTIGKGHEMQKAVRVLSELIDI